MKLMLTNGSNSIELEVITLLIRTLGLNNILKIAFNDRMLVILTPDLSEVTENIIGDLEGNMVILQPDNEDDMLDAISILKGVILSGKNLFENIRLSSTLSVTPLT